MNTTLTQQNKKDFDLWNEIKKSANCSKINFNFSERDVWFIKMGVNVGFEQDGKGDEYMRPVIVIKKFNKTIFLGIPLSKRSKKDLPFYHSFEFKGKRSTAILSQIRLFDSKRLKFRLGKLSQHDFKEVKAKLTQLLE